MDPIKARPKYKAVGVAAPIRFPNFMYKKVISRKCLEKKNGWGIFASTPFPLFGKGFDKIKNSLFPPHPWSQKFPHPSVLFGMKNDPIFFCSFCPFFMPFNILVILLCWKFMGETWAGLNPNQHGLTRPILNLG